MSKISLPVFLLSLLLLAINTNLVAGNENICHEGLGFCGSDCDAKCKARHKPTENPKGSCNRIGNMVLCDCLYSCSGPPKPNSGSNVCNDGIGMCSARCDNDCCDAECGQLHNGGHGSCDNTVGVRLCQCTYPCSSK